MANPRVQRGRATQELLAQWFRDNGWTGATSRAASLPGSDIYGVPFAPEVKATAGISWTQALAQAARNADGKLPFVVYRPQGYGPARIGEWVVSFTLADATVLLRKAGY